MLFVYSRFYDDKQLWQRGHSSCGGANLWRRQKGGIQLPPRTAIYGKQRLPVCWWIQATIHVNPELTTLYYNIGTAINEYKTWGNKFIENLPLRSRWDHEEGAGQPFHRSAALKGQKRFGGGILPQGYEQTNGGQRISDHQQSTGRTGEAVALCGESPETDKGE